MKRVAALVLLAALAASGSAQLNPKLGKRVGKPLPRFSAQTITGTRLTNASLRGKVVLLDFWATWCGPCKASSPAMQRLHANLGGKGLMVIGADTYEQGARNTAAPYKKKHGYTYAFIENNDEFAANFGVETLPAYVLVDAKGVVRKVWSSLPIGGPDVLYSQITAAAKPLLKG